MEIKEKLKELLDEKLFRTVVEMDSDLFTKLPKSGVDGIVRGNLIRNLLDRIYECVDISYPDLSVRVDTWKIEPEKLDIKAELYVLSKDEVNQIIEQIVSLFQYPITEEDIASAGTLTKEL